MVGANITAGALKQDDPKAYAKWCASYGINTVRFHHWDIAVAEGRLTEDDLIKLADALLAEGIRFSIDVFTEIGLKYPSGQDQFKRDLMGLDPEAIRFWISNIRTIERLIKHKGCWLVCLSNECAWACVSESQMLEWWDWASGVINKINPLVLITDASDAHTQSKDGKPKFAKVCAMHDIPSMHLYLGKEDFTDESNPDWTTESWNFNGARMHVDYVQWYRNDAKQPKAQFFIQEFGSWAKNPHYAHNIVFLTVMANFYGWSTCQFALDTGSDTDKYAMKNDKLLMNLLLLQTSLAKKKLDIEYWAGFENQNASFLSAVGDKVSINQDFAQIGDKLWSWDKETPWLWLVRAYEAVAVNTK